MQRISQNFILDSYLYVGIVQGGCEYLEEVGRGEGGDVQGPRQAAGTGWPDKHGLVFLVPWEKVTFPVNRVNRCTVACTGKVTFYKVPEKQ